MDSGACEVGGESTKVEGVQTFWMVHTKRRASFVLRFLNGSNSLRFIERVPVVVEINK